MILEQKLMVWFLYDNGLHHEIINARSYGTMLIREYVHAKLVKEWQLSNLFL